MYEMNELYVNPSHDQSVKFNITSAGVRHLPHMFILLLSIRENVHTYIYLE